VSLSPGTRLGPYEVLAPLGAGAMGAVYRARDPRLEREVAIKVLPPELARDPERLRRFTLEARAAGALQHPNIAAVFDVGTHEGLAYVVEELVPGGTLQDRLGRGAVPMRDAVRLAAGIAAGLAAAHEKGIVHRDLKPANVAIASDGRPQVLDFGLARVARPSDDATLAVDSASAGMLIGTVGYMAPEQVRGEAVDGRADLFALGTMLHEMLSGSRPFARGSAVETMHAILADETPPLPASVPPALARVVERCLAKDPAQRFQSARDLSFTLELVSGDTRREQSVEGSPAIPAPGRSRPAWAFGVAIAVIAVVAFLAGRFLPRAAGESSLLVTSLSYGGQDNEPSASPDGRLVAYSSVRDNGAGIRVMEVATRNELGPRGHTASHRGRRHRRRLGAGRLADRLPHRRRRQLRLRRPAHGGEPGRQRRATAGEVGGRGLVLAALVPGRTLDRGHGERQPELARHPATRGRGHRPAEGAAHTPTRVAHQRLLGRIRHRAARGRGRRRRGRAEWPARAALPHRRAHGPRPPARVVERVPRPHRPDAGREARHVGDARAAEPA